MTLPQFIATAVLVNHFHSSERATGGVALLTSNDFPQNHIPLNTNIEAIAVQIHIRQLITVCSTYLPPNDTLCQQDLNPLTPSVLI